MRDCPAGRSRGEKVAKNLFRVVLFLKNKLKFGIGGDAWEISVDVCFVFVEKNNGNYIDQVKALNTSMDRLPLQARTRFRLSLGMAFFLGLVAMFGGYRDNSMLIGLGIAGVVVAGLFSLILGLGLPSLRRKLSGMVAGDFVAHWVFSDDDWEKHCRRAHKRRRSDFPTYLLMGLTFGLILGGTLLAYRVYGEGSSWRTDWPHAALLAGGVLLLFVFAGLPWDLYEWLTLRGWRNCREVYIGAPGLYIGGDFWPSRVPNPRLAKARFEAAPDPLLLFDYEIRVKSGFYIKEVCVPVPRGQERQAQKIAAWVLEAWR